MGPLMRNNGHVPIRILTVEDDERIRQSVRLALEDEGWAVDEAETGEEAIKVFGRSPADVLLIDIMLPGMDGFEVCRQIRRLSDVPIVMVTARDDTHDVVAGLEAGADDYLTKPYQTKELSARIRALLRRASFGRTGSQPVAVRRLGDRPRRRAGDPRRRDPPPHQDRVPTVGGVGQQPRQGLLPRGVARAGVGGTTTSATAASWMSTCAGSAPRSSTTRPTRATWSRFEAWATSSSPDPMADSPGFRLFGHLGLRRRIAATFALGSMLLSVALMSVGLLVVRTNLVSQQEAELAERAQVNAGQVGPKIGQPDIDAQTLFGSLLTAGSPSVLIRDSFGSGGFVPVSADTAFGASSIPPSMAEAVLEEKQISIMRFDNDGEIVVAVGVPLSDDGGYFEVAQLSAIEQSIRDLRVPLAVIAVVASVGAAMAAWYSSRRLLRPLSEVGEVAQEVAEGHLEARVTYVDWTDDPDLSPLVQSFNGMVAALERRIDRDTRFASDVSHELRSPLTTINNSVEVLAKARHEMPERAQKAVDLLSEDTVRFKQLVEDLLEISRFDAGAVRVELEEIDLGETVRWAIRGLTAVKIPVEVDEELDGVLIRSDKRRLMRVLANFLDNAAKYADGAKRVVVTAHRHDDDADTEALSEDGDRRSGAPDTIRVIVEDEGPGVPAEQRDEIFDRFNRGTKGGSRSSDFGVGLGLALASEHARIQGGSIWVEDRPDNRTGARFVLELPYIEAAAPAETLDVMADTPDDDTAAEPDGTEELVTATGQHSAIVVDEPDESS